MTPFEDPEWQRLAAAYHAARLAEINHEIEHAEEEVARCRRSQVSELARRHLELARIQDLFRPSRAAAKERVVAEAAYMDILRTDPPAPMPHRGLELLAARQAARKAMDARWREVSEAILAEMERS